MPYITVFFRNRNQYNLILKKLELVFLDYLLSILYFPYLFYLIRNGRWIILAFIFHKILILRLIVFIFSRFSLDIKINFILKIESRFNDLNTTLYYIWPIWSTFFWVIFIQLLPILARLFWWNVIVSALICLIYLKWIRLFC